MSKTVISIFTFCTVMLVTLSTAAQAQKANSGDIEKTKAAVSQYRARPLAKVVVRLNSGATHKGFIMKASEESFELSDINTQRSIDISYGDVRSIKAAGSGISKLWIRTGIAAGIIVTAVVFVPKKGPLICPLGCRR